MEAKVNRKVQENMTWYLKKLGEANPTLKFDIGDFCATFSSDQDETDTPMTLTPGGATSQFCYQISGLSYIITFVHLCAYVIWLSTFTIEFGIELFWSLLAQFGGLVGVVWRWLLVSLCVGVVWSSMVYYRSLDCLWFIIVVWI